MLLQPTLQLLPQHAAVAIAWIQRRVVTVRHYESVHRNSAVLLNTCTVTTLPPALRGRPPGLHDGVGGAATVPMRDLDAGVRRSGVLAVTITAALLTGGR